MGAAPSPKDVTRAATLEDVPAVAACLADAFHEDPLWGPWTFPDATTRAASLTAFMTFWATCGVRLPWLRMTDGAESVALWLPPGEPELTPAEAAQVGPLLTGLLGARAPEVEALFDQFDAHHPHDEPHYYLGWWATHREHAGRGLGTALMRANLESTNPANLARYEALGFEARAEFGPPGGPVITTMWRAAR